MGRLFNKIVIKKIKLTKFPSKLSKSMNQKYSQP